MIAFRNIQDIIHSVFQNINIDDDAPSNMQSIIPLSF